jgi:hypothetical protein
MEYILCAAIWVNDGEKYIHQPNNIETGMVFCGRRHHNCFVILNKAMPEWKEAENVVQGFITSEDRFVDREEAARVAHSAQQIKNAMERLFSEDLY